MRRVHAIFVIVALLATPVALLARSECGDTACECMCSLVQKSVSSPAQHAKGKMLCGVAQGQKHTCTTGTRHHPLDYGLNTLMAPTAPLSFATLAAAVTAPYSPDPYAQFAPLGFLSEPFQPPRS